MSHDPDRWLTLSEVADMLGVHTSTVRSWADQGRLPVHRTQGGHRRFRLSEVELCLSSQDARGVNEISRVVQNALKNTRLQIAEGRLEAEDWYAKLDEDTRTQYRKSGRSLLSGLMNYLVLDEQGAEAEARALGYEYASLARRNDLSYVDAVHAFLFFRNMLMEATLSVYEGASIRSALAWGDMFRKINSFTDHILETILETYEAFQRSSR